MKRLGQTVSIAELAEYAGVDEATLRARLNIHGLLAGHGDVWERQIKSLIAKMLEERSTIDV